MRCVDAVHIKRGLGLGITELLRVCQHVGERLAGLFHAGQDIVAGAVQNTGHTGDAIAGQAFAKRLHRRNATGHGGLEHQPDSLRFGQRGKFRAMMRQQRLVGRHHMLAGLQRRTDQVQRDPALAADHLDNDIDIVARGDIGRILDPGDARHVKPAVGGAAARADGGDGERSASDCGDFSAAMAELAGGFAADDAETGDTDTKRLLGGIVR